MMKSKRYEGIVSESLLNEFEQENQGAPSLMNYAANCVGLQETLAVANLFWPRIIQIDDLVFIAEFYGEDAPLHIPSVGYSHEQKQKLERDINAWSLRELFWNEKPEVLNNEALLSAFGETLRFFWSMRLQQLFPEKEFVFEIGEGIAGENGLSITFYER